MLKRIFSILLLTTITAVPLLAPQTTHAATFRSSETLTVNEALTDLYAAGGTVNVTSPVTNDLTVAGGTINLEASVSGSLLATGGTLNLDGDVAQSVRAAGGTINVTAPVSRDAVLFGGSITLSETAAITGDLIVTGGTVTIQGPVTGNIHVNGGQVVLNSAVGGNVSGTIDRLVIGNRAVINGDLNYTSPERATLRDGAVIRGIENYTHQERGDQETEKIAGMFTSFSLYKLMTDILASLALIYLLYGFTKRVIDIGSTDTVKSGVLGLVTVILLPILGFFLLILILPGIMALILYLILLILAAFISKLLIGRFLLTWWYSRQQRRYVLDWKAAVIGPLVMFVLLLLPVVGWLVGFLFFLVALGSITLEMFSWISAPKTETATTRAATRTTKPVKRTTKKR